jgi:hypothetical protein
MTCTVDISVIEEISLIPCVPVSAVRGGRKFDLEELKGVDLYSKIEIFQARGSILDGSLPGRGM